MVLVPNRAPAAEVEAEEAVVRRLEDDGVLPLVKPGPEAGAVEVEAFRGLRPGMVEVVVVVDEAGRGPDVEADSGRRAPAAVPVMFVEREVGTNPVELPGLEVEIDVELPGRTPDIVRLLLGTIAVGRGLICSSWTSSSASSSGGPFRFLPATSPFWFPLASPFSLSRSATSTLGFPGEKASKMGFKGDERNRGSLDVGAGIPDWN